MFKELYEIANDFIPSILKRTSAEKGDNNAATKNANLAEDPSFFALVLQFYDGVCLWEEGSHTPVLHADWAKKLVQSISRFSPACRSALSSSKLGTVTPALDSKNNNAPEAVSFNTSSSSEDNKLHNKGQSSCSQACSKTELVLTLKSEKMRGMRDLLTTDGKINTSAIKLQLTAQSQVSVPKSRRRSSFKTDDYVYDFGDEAEGEEEEGEEEEEEEERDRRSKKTKLDFDYTIY